jgi:hypothetical protein
MTNQSVGASFRDPSGFVFEHEGSIYRQVNQRYADDYEMLMSSGLYERLVSGGLLIPHEVVPPPSLCSEHHYRTLLPERVPFISYPYEWSFGQLKDAAIATLRVQKIALQHGMTLKDASAYNVQFVRGDPLMIDTLSFERYRDGTPWVGYRQFCQHFLAPLALMAYCDGRLLELLRVQIDGVPLDLAASLLPARAWLRLGLVIHIRTHARYQERYQSVGGGTTSGEGIAEKLEFRRMPKQALANLTEGLLACVRRLQWSSGVSEWSHYYSGDSYAEGSLAHKQELVRSHIDSIQPQTVWDVGANTGLYSRIAAESGANVISFDLDPACVERNYRKVREDKEERILPLLLDLVNPSPAIGWAHEERSSLVDRASADLILALGLVHHIAISNNVPLSRIASFFAKLARHLVIEFIPKSDSKVRTLLATREDIFPDYTREGFEQAFGSVYRVEAAAQISSSERILYSMSRIDHAAGRG